MVVEPKAKAYSVILGMVLFIAASVVGAGYYAFARYNATTFETQWNSRYSQPTFPLDDNPETKPDSRMWTTR